MRIGRSASVFAILSTLMLSSISFAASPAVITQNIDETKLVTLTGNTRPEAKKQNDRGVVADDLQLDHMLLQLKRPPAQEQKLQEFIAQQQDKSSPNFHHWLTAKQYGQRFGLAAQDLDTITRWLESHGFKVNLVYDNGMLIDFSGTAGEVRAAFHTEVHNLDVKGMKHIANVNDPQIPAALAPVVAGIVSLHDFKPHTNYKPRASFNGGTGCDFGDCYLVVPGDLATIYNLNPLFSGGISGQGQTIVVIEDTDLYTTSDWDTFRSTFGLSSYAGTFSYSHPGSNCSGPGVNPDGDDVEATLDAEYASASAPSAAIVMASCGNTQTTFGGFIAIQNVLNESGTPPAIMSISYGECETGNGAASNAAFNAAFQQAVTEGVSVFVSSGDEGAASCNANDPAATYGIGVSGWASTPYNVAVGGTDFGDTYASSTGAYWNSTTNTVANFTGGVTNGSTVVTAPAGTFGACFVGAAISGTDIVPGATIIAVASPTSATMSNSATATDASDPITISSINSAACSSALSYIPEIPWNDSCASGLIAQYLGYPQTYGASGLCGSGQGLTTASGSGGPSGCATGSPSVPGVVGGTCAGTPKPSWQSLVGNAGDGVRDIPDVSLFAANGVWDHYYPFCFSDPSNGGAPCTDTPANWPGAGGTSFSAPIMAGIQALINQNAGGPQGNPNPVYYQLAAAEYGTGGSSSCNSTLGNAAASSCIFYDVTQGDMDVNCLPLSGSESFNCYFDSAVNGVLSTSTSTYQPAFGASTGWDFATGIGTVNAYNLVTNWPVALATTTTVISGQNPAFQGVAVTFTATVSPTGTHAPSGTVTFNDGGSAIGSGTLGASGGSQVATFTTSSLDLGPHSITAVYAGDSYNATSTSAILTETINADPTFNFSSQPTTPAPAAAGTATISTFTVAPTGTGVTTFAANVTLACNGLPDPTVTCSFSTNPIPAGSNATNETLTITTIGPNKAGANNHPRSADNRSPWLPLTLPLAGIVMVGLAGRKISKYSAIAGLCASLLLLGFLLACGKNTPVAISVSPEGATVFANGPSGSTWPPQTATFTATVSNTNNTGVNWTVTTSNGGSIASDGTYTAPIIAAGLPSSATITATSQADSSKTATATVTITPTSVPGTYPLTVTATEGPTQNTSSSFNLTVQ